MELYTDINDERNQTNNQYR